MVNKMKISQRESEASLALRYMICKTLSVISSDIFACEKGEESSLASLIS